MCKLFSKWAYKLSLEHVRVMGWNAHRLGLLHFKCCESLNLPPEIFFNVDLFAVTIINCCLPHSNLQQTIRFKRYLKGGDTLKKGMDSWKCTLDRYIIFPLTGTLSSLFQNMIEHRQIHPLVLKLYLPQGKRGM